MPDNFRLRIPHSSIITFFFLLLWLFFFIYFSFSFLLFLSSAKTFLILVFQILLLFLLNARTPQKIVLFATGTITSPAKKNVKRFLAFPLLFVCFFFSHFLQEEYKCMYCFNSSYCVPFEGISSEEECEDSPVCVLENGEVLWGVGEEECGRRQACSSAEGSSEADCLAAGSCEDPDHIFESIEVLNFFFVSSLCFLTLFFLGFNSQLSIHCNSKKWGLYYPS